MRAGIEVGVVALAALLAVASQGRAEDETRLHRTFEEGTVAAGKGIGAAFDGLMGALGGLGNGVSELILDDEPAAGEVPVDQDREQWLNDDIKREFAAGRVMSDYDRYRCRQYPMPNAPDQCLQYLMDRLGDLKETVDGFGDDEDSELIVTALEKWRNEAWIELSSRRKVR